MKLLISIKNFLFYCLYILFFVTFLGLPSVFIFSAISPIVDDKIYRNEFSSNSSCEIQLLINPDALKNTKPSRCSIQEIQLPISKKNTSNEQSELFYKLAFLEFKEDGKLFSEQQISNILELIKAEKEKQKLVVVYVHGWRHNADFGNKDLHRFRTLLAYSRQFLRQRKLNEDRELIGIYVSWRGIEVEENSDDSFATNLAKALPTFWRRKSASDNLGVPVVNRLNQISKILKQTNSENKMLVTGHSMGGNILVTGLHDQIETTLQNYEHQNSDKKPYELPLADLVVLFNPASEARNWFVIEELLKKWRGKEKKNFNINQRPVFISLTATKFWKNYDIKSKTTPHICSNYFYKIKTNWFEVKLKTDEWFKNILTFCNLHDYATREIFSIAKLLSFEFRKDEFISMGHYIPKTFFAFIQLDNKGSTHELVLNNSTGATKIQNVEEHSKCDVINGALKTARVNKNSKYNWDSNYSYVHGLSDHKFVEVIKNKKLFRFNNDKNNQIRYGILTHYGEGERPSNVPLNSPFWNVRVKNSIEEHGHFVNYPTWCLLHQLILDDVTD